MKNGGRCCKVVLVVWVASERIIVCVEHEAFVPLELVEVFQKA